ncbi:hypothetical protein FXN63_09065 [Pigmentiphaga aceris]|uniref:Arginase family protein n=1 Tax=Pigmentiphaga aceris TaxID=1940612 RepID=A0A5C0B4N7_9BURK|nr:hypothetical protein FXN63_09065 [Pigmentiphaga aceris]
MSTPVIPAPVILDIDSSVGDLPDAHRLDLREHHETLRLGCSLPRMRWLTDKLDRMAPASADTVMLGSGDFHHLSWPLIARQNQHGQMRVLVFDNHPDNMRFIGGVHCGSWVRRVTALPFVSRVDVVGITSQDIGASHAWENYLRPLWSGKLRYWSIGVDTRWSRWVGASRAFCGFPDADALVQALVNDLGRSSEPAYVSVDKDVFSTEVLRTNWDQGVMRANHVDAVIAALRGRVVASDITGEVSRHTYSTAWKRWVSAGDGQDADLSDAQVEAWRPAQHTMNLRLIDWLARARAA